MTIQEDGGIRRLLLSHSYRMTWNQCHRKAYWVGVKRLRTEVEPDYFIRGTLGHEMVDAFWKHPQREAMADMVAGELIAKVHYADPLLEAGLTEYFKRNLDNPDGLVFKDHRGPFMRRLPDRWRGTWEVYYTGDADGIAEWNGADWVVERKFGKRIPSNVVAQFQLDDQIRGYAWYYRERFPNIKGAIIEVTRCTNNPDTVRDWVIFEDHHLQEFEADLNHVADEIIDAYEEDRWPMSPHSCYAWGECSFRRLCLNTDRAAFAETLGYKIEEVTHEEKTLERLNVNPTA
jgi:hypothetical protein